ncbi:MAG: ketoacyl-ACP synthase III [Proteobacteria bacterium]|nr:ketoacyl-ACP synthase III [Pseudomonadota bacterium]
MSLSFPGVQLRAVTAALPKTRLEIADLAPIYGETEVQRISASTGVTSVRVAKALSTGDLCVAAARHLLDKAGVLVSDIDAIVIITQTPDRFMPGVSFEVHARLGLSPSCLTFDLNYGCPGFVYGLLQASMLVHSGCKNVLLCTGDVTTKLIKPGDRHIQTVFGDAVGAVLVGAGSNRIDFLFETDGSGGKYLHTPLTYSLLSDRSATVGHLHMDGGEVMKFALSRVPPLVNQLLEQCEVSQEEVGVALLHQANALMLRYLRKLMGFTTEQCVIDLVETGNTGPASIPLVMARLQEIPAERLNKVMMCGFGIGLSVATAITSLKEAQLILPVEVI